MHRLAVSPAEARARAKAVAQQNTVNGKAFALTDADVVLGKWTANDRKFVAASAANEATADAVQITGHLEKSRGSDVRLVWLPLLGGQTSSELAAQSTSTQTSAAQDLVLVQDVSYSFLKRSGSRGPATSTCSTR